MRASASAMRPGVGLSATSASARDRKSTRQLQSLAYLVCRLLLEKKKQALAYQGSLLGIPATVVMPKHSPLIKIGNCEKFGATVVLHGKEFAEARIHADRLCEKRGLAYINGYDDPAIIAGQGKMGIEIVEQVPDV